MAKRPRSHRSMISTAASTPAFAGAGSSRCSAPDGGRLMKFAVTKRQISLNRRAGGVHFNKAGNSLNLARQSG